MNRAPLPVAPPSQQVFASVPDPSGSLQAANDFLSTQTQFATEQEAQAQFEAPPQPQNNPATAAVGAASAGDDGMMNGLNMLAPPSFLQTKQRMRVKEWPEATTYDAPA